MALLLCWGHTYFITLWTWIHLRNAFSSFVELLVTFYDALKTISVTAQATHQHTKASSTSALLAFMAVLPTEVSGEIVWHQKPQINPSVLWSLFHDHGCRVWQTGRLVPAPGPFNCLPDGSLIQAGISHPIDNVTSVSCCFNAHYQLLILSSVRCCPLCLSHCLILIC